MCGIAGIISSNVDERDCKIIEAMKRALVHRGPDSHGTVSGEGFVLGHQRLSIIDIEHGQQPMQTQDERWIIVYNGEVYNYIELREDLLKEGVTFQTSSDTEVLLQLVRTKGVDALLKVNGMFAFAVYDKQEKRLFCARDPFGIKPFYYTITDKGQFLFASEIKALLAHPDVDSKVDQHALQEYLTFQFCLKQKTLFKGIQKLEPGHYLTYQVQEKQPHIERYWQLDYVVDQHHTQEYFSDTIFSIIDESVGLQLRSDVPVGAYLSGGLDSGIVSTLGAQKVDYDFHTFHGRFKEYPEYDESEYARMIADSAGCHFHEIIPSADDFIDLLPKLIYHMDEPAAGPGLFPQYMTSFLASESVKVVLAGTGGDEIFGGYARYIVAYLEQCLKGAIFETQEEGQHIVTMESIVPNLSYLKQYGPMLKSFWKEGLFDDMDQRYYRLINRSHDAMGFMNQDICKDWQEDRMFEEFKDVFHHPDTRSYLNKMTHFDQKTLLPALLQVEDRVSMACSLESRVPLLDRRLVDLINKMPPNIKFRGGEMKYIFKRAIDGKLPEEVLHRKDKMGFPVPLKEWYEGPLKDFVVDILFSKEARGRGIFDSAALEDVVKKERKYSRQVWGALCLELWFQQFKVSL